MLTISMIVKVRFFTLTFALKSEMKSVRPQVIRGLCITISLPIVKRRVICSTMHYFTFNNLSNQPSLYVALFKINDNNY